MAIEKYLLQYANLYNLRPLIIRLSNPYGRFHYSNKQGACNIALRSGLERNTFKVWGKGDSRKDYIYIDDFCDILFQLLSKSIHSIILNIASGNVLTLNQILEEVKILIPDFTSEYVQSSIYDVSHFELDTQVLHSIIGEYNFSNYKYSFKTIINWINETV